MSDGSDDDAAGAVVERVLAGWAGGHPYVHNRPPLSLVENMNRAVEISTGQWVMQLDDDDFLLPGAGQAMLDAIRRAGPDEAVLLFGVRIVDRAGERRREQRFRRERYLEPSLALRRLLRNSSFVREPTAVVRRATLEQEGLFDTTVSEATDTDMWVRLFSRYGVRCLPSVTCAYTVHEAAATTGLWNPDTIQTMETIFDRAVSHGVVPEREVRRWQADWYHQFILAGAYRRMRVRRRSGSTQCSAHVRPAPGPEAGPIVAMAASASRVRGRHHRCTGKGHQVLTAARRRRENCPRSLDPLQPDLPPVGIDAARALTVVGADAGHLGQDDARILEPEHLAGGLIDDLLDPPQHSELLAAITHHLAVEGHTTVGVVDVEGSDDLLQALDPYQLPGLQVERLLRRFVEPTLEERVAPPASQPQPRGQPAPARVLVLVEQANGDRAGHGHRADIA